jgi:hypothetical protein
MKFSVSVNCVEESSVSLRGNSLVELKFPLAPKLCDGLRFSVDVNLEDEWNEDDLSNTEVFSNSRVLAKSDEARRIEETVKEFESLNCGDGSRGTEAMRIED